MDLSWAILYHEECFILFQHVNQFGWQQGTTKSGLQTDCPAQLMKLSMGAYLNANHSGVALGILFLSLYLFRFQSPEILQKNIALNIQWSPALTYCWQC